MGRNDLDRYMDDYMSGAPMTWGGEQRRHDEQSRADLARLDKQMAAARRAKEQRRREAEQKKAQEKAAREAKAAAEREQRKLEAEQKKAAREAKAKGRPSPAAKQAQPATTTAGETATSGSEWTVQDYATAFSAFFGVAALAPVIVAGHADAFDVATPDLNAGIVGCTNTLVGNLVELTGLFSEATGFEHWFGAAFAAALFGVVGRILYRWVIGLLLLVGAMVAAG